MYDYFKGILISKNFPNITIENNGIGYNFIANARTINQIGEINSEVKIWAKLIHKEDSMTLCGFLSKQDKIIFNILTSVSGVGLKVALALLDEFETTELIDAVIEENHKLISRTKGVGAKMAQKIVLELKDKLTKMDINASLIQSKNTNTKISTETLLSVQTILTSLGYSQSEYNEAIDKAIEKIQKDDPQDLLKETLQILSTF